MKLFGAIIIFLIAFGLFLMLLLLLFIRKAIKRFRQHLTGDYDDETVRRMSDKHYRGSDASTGFDKDYFKGKGHSKRDYSQNQSQHTQQETVRQRTTTTTSDGTTIIDEQSKAERQKIFSDNEGEYVEFTEE